MISALQIIILLPLFDSRMPANTGTFFGVLMQIAAFDIFEINGYLDEYLNMKPSDPVNEKFETIGLESIYFMNNLGTFTLVLASKLILILVWILLYLPASCSRKVRKLRNKFGQRIFWNSWIVAIVESFLIISLCGAISLKYSIIFDTIGETVQSSFCLFCLSIYVLLPLYALIKALKDFKALGTSEMLHSYGAFYAGISLKHGRKVLIFPALQLVRRVFLVYIVI